MFSDNSTARRRRPHFILGTVIILLCALRSGFCQSPAVIGYIADTNIGQCVAISPDDRNLYVGGLHSMAAFERLPNDSLKIIQVLNNNHLGVSGIQNVIDLVVSPDGKYVYAVNMEEQALLIFSRDFVTGKINFVESVKDSVFTSIRDIIPSAREGYKLIVSPLGEHLYWLYSPSSYTTGNVFACFARDYETGRLSKAQILRNGENGLKGYKVPSAMTISPDGKYFYGIGYNDSKLLAFSRDSLTGRIQYLSETPSISIPEWHWESSSIAVSGDGNSIYATSSISGKLLMFHRTADSADHAFLGTTNKGDAAGILLSPNGQHVYVSGDGGLSLYARHTDSGRLDLIQNFNEIRFYTPSGYAISHDGKVLYLPSAYKRNSRTGRLTGLQTIPQNIGGTDRLDGAKAVGVSHDGNALLVAAHDYGDAGINVFSRNRDDGRLGAFQFYPQPNLATMFLSPDGQFLYAVNDARNGRDTTIQVFRYDTLSQSLLAVQEIFGKGEFPAFSPAGDHLYLSSQSGMLIYARDPHSGKLNLVQTLVARDLNMVQRFSVAVSPDGRYVYWGGHYYLVYTGYEAAIFERNPQTGELTFLKRQRFAQMHPGWGLKFSPDGKFVYAGAQAQNAYNYTGEILATFSCNASTGDLTLLEIFRRGIYEICIDLEMSADTKDVYALFTGQYYGIAGGGTMLAMYERSPETGKLTLRYTFPNDNEKGFYGGGLFEDLTISPDGAFAYVTDARGVATFSTGRRGSVSVAEENPFASMLPRTLKLEQNYPNPFSSSTTHASQRTTLIHYEIAAAYGNAQPVELAIYNTQGQLVRMLVNEAQATGKHAATWNGANAQGQLVPSGVYFYRLKMGEQMITKKLLVVQ